MHDDTYDVCLIRESTCVYTHHSHHSQHVAMQLWALGIATIVRTPTMLSFLRKVHHFPLVVRCKNDSGRSRCEASVCRSCTQVGGTICEFRDFYNIYAVILTDEPRDNVRLCGFGSGGRYAYCCACISDPRRNYFSASVPFLTHFILQHLSPFPHSLLCLLPSVKTTLLP